VVCVYNRVEGDLGPNVVCGYEWKETWDLMWCVGTTELKETWDLMWCVGTEWKETRDLMYCH